MARKTSTEKFKTPVKGKNGKTYSVTSVSAKARGKKAEAVKKKVLASVDRRGKSTNAIRGLVYDDYRGTMTVRKSNKKTVTARHNAKVFGRGAVKGKNGKTHYTGGGF